MKNPPNIQAARVIAPAVVELVWSTGETLSVNLKDLPKRNAAFAKLAENYCGLGHGVSSSRVAEVTPCSGVAWHREEASLGSPEAVAWA